jgi:hypothetical protein
MIWSGAPTPESLSSAQRAALGHVESLARARVDEARASLRRLLARTGATEAALEAALGALRRHARVMLHFHPDRLCSQGHSVAEGLLRDGIYKSQFETGLSSGSLTAFAGGQRDEWERSLFGGAYHAREVPLAERPTYGALELVRHADGPSPRFGSCYLVLRPEVSKRCSFTYGGSQSPDVLEHSGTLEHPECWLLALLEAVARDGAGLGVSPLGVTGLLESVTHGVARRYEGPAERSVGRSLDSFVEAQVHGPVRLATDVEWLVADPAFQGTRVEQDLRAAARQYSFELAWHPGFTLAVSEVPADFRGPAMPPLARRIARDGSLDVAAIGVAAASLQRNPEAWSDRGPYADTLQHLKQLWHVLVQYGGPRR